jgi:hypothetical protein
MKTTLHIGEHLLGEAKSATGERRCRCLRPRPQGIRPRHRVDRRAPPGSGTRRSTRTVMVACLLVLSCAADTEILATYPSPDGRCAAVLWVQSGGGAAGWSLTQVTVLSTEEASGSPLHQRAVPGLQPILAAPDLKIRFQGRPDLVDVATQPDRCAGDR